MRYFSITSRVGRRSVVVGAAFVGLVAIGVAACGGSKEEAKDPYLPPEGEEPAAPVSEAPECVDQNNEPVKCQTDADCCSGFVCGKDPELNSREKFCIYAG